MGFLNRMFGTKRQGAGNPREKSAERSSDAARLIKETEHFLLLTVESSTSAHVMLMRADLINQVASSSQLAFEEAAKMTAGQLFTLSDRGSATKEEAIRGGIEVFQKASVTRFPKASAAISINRRLPNWEVPVVAVIW